MGMHEITSEQVRELLDYAYNGKQSVRDLRKAFADRIAKSTGGKLYLDILPGGAYLKYSTTVMPLDGFGKLNREKAQEWLDHNEHGEQLEMPVRPEKPKPEKKSTKKEPTVTVTATYYDAMVKRILGLEEENEKLRARVEDFANSMPRKEFWEYIQEETGWTIDERTREYIIRVPVNKMIEKMEGRV